MVTGPDAPGAQPGGQFVGAGVQLPVAQGALAAGQGGRLGAQGDLVREGLVDAAGRAGRRDGRAGRAAEGELLGGLRLVEQEQVDEGGPGRHRGQLILYAGDMAPGKGGFGDGCVDGIVARRTEGSGEEVPDRAALGQVGLEHGPAVESAKGVRRPVERRYGHDHAHGRPALVPSEHECGGGGAPQGFGAGDTGGMRCGGVLRRPYLLRPELPAEHARDQPERGRVQRGRIGDEDEITGTRHGRPHGALRGPVGGLTREVARHPACAGAREVVRGAGRRDGCAPAPDSPAPSSSYRSSSTRSSCPGPSGRRVSVSRRRAALAESAGAGTVSLHSRGCGSSGHHRFDAAASAVATGPSSVAPSGRRTVSVWRAVGTGALLLVGVRLSAS